MVLSRSPLSPFNTVEFLLSSGKPISRNVASLESIVSSDAAAVYTREGLLTSTRTGAGGDSIAGLMGAVCARKVKPNRFPVFGGNGGGESSDSLPPVLSRLGGRGLPSANDRCSYFCLMNRSIAGSTSSASMGIEGLIFLGLYTLFEATFPVRFIFWYPSASINLLCGRDLSRRLDPMTNCPCSKT